MPTSSRCSGYEFAVNLRKNGLFCRVDVGIDPYKQAGRFSAQNEQRCFFDSPNKPAAICCSGLDLFSREKTEHLLHAKAAQEGELFPAGVVGVEQNDRGLSTGAGEKAIPAQKLRREMGRMLRADLL